MKRTLGIVLSMFMAFNSLNIAYAATRTSSNEITSVNISVSDIVGGKSITMSGEDYIKTTVEEDSGDNEVTATNPENTTSAQDNINKHIYYTLDGSDPYSGENYTGAIELTEEGKYNIRAVADYSKLSNSAKHEIASMEVVVEKADAPEITMDDNYYINITSSYTGAKIYYTTDGSEPTQDSQLYTDEFEITEECEIRAVAAVKGYMLSDAASEYFYYESESESEYDTDEDSDDDDDTEIITGITIENDIQLTTEEYEEDTDSEEYEEDYYSEEYEEYTEETSESTDSEKIVKVYIGKNTMDVNGETIPIDAAAYIQRASSSTMVPLRFVSVALNTDSDIVAYADDSSKILWDANTKTASILYENDNGLRIIQFTANSPEMVIDGTPVTMENSVVAELVDARMYIPVRAFAQAIDASVQWDSDERCAIFEK